MSEIFTVFFDFFFKKTNPYFRTVPRFNADAAPVILFSASPVGMLVLPYAAVTSCVVGGGMEEATIFLYMFCVSKER